MDYGYILPFRPKKGKSFRLYFPNINEMKSFEFDGNPEIPDILKISKDESPFVDTTNQLGTIGSLTSSPVMKYLDLTANEMRGNVIFIMIKYPSTANDGLPKTFVIYTDGFRGF